MQYCVRLATIQRNGTDLTAWLRAVVLLLFAYYFNNLVVAFCIVFLSYDFASGKEITPCNKIDKPLVVYRFSGNVMK